VVTRRCKKPGRATGFRLSLSSAGGWMLIKNTRSGSEGGKVRGSALLGTFKNSSSVFQASTRSLGVPLETCPYPCLEHEIVVLASSSALSLSCLCFVTLATRTVVKWLSLHGPSLLLLLSSLSLSACMFACLPACWFPGSTAYVHARLGALLSPSATHSPLHHSHHDHTAPPPLSHL
jgi:hypothetical protein